LTATTRIALVELVRVLPSVRICSAVTFSRCGSRSRALRATTASPDTPRGRRTLTVDEAAQALGISRSTAYECVRNGSLPALRFRRRIVISAVVIEQLVGSSDLMWDDSTRASRAG
jgi:excisionase family DNA binding protein